MQIAGNHSLNTDGGVLRETGWDGGKEMAQWWQTVRRWLNWGVGREWFHDDWRKRWGRGGEERVLSPLCVLYYMPLSPGRIGFDVHERTPTLPPWLWNKLPSTSCTRPALVCSSTHLSSCQNSDIHFGQCMWYVHTACWKIANAYKYI